MAKFIALKLFDCAPPEGEAKHQLVNLNSIYRLGLTDDDWEWPQWPEGGKWADIVIDNEHFYLSAKERDKLLDFIKQEECPANQR